VLDSSAVLAWVRGEPGADLVGERLATAVISAVNWSETVQKFVQHGVTVDRAIGRLLALGLSVEPLTVADAVAAARLWTNTRALGLSLGDRCCLALAQRLSVPAVTADTAWSQLTLSVEVERIR
jgi:ribonuclease VapC